MRHLVLLSTLVLAITSAATLEAHGIPILITADGGKQFFTDAKVYSSGAFELLVGVVLTTDLPGYSVVDSKQGISFGATLKLNVIDQLLWWQNGVVRLDTAEKLDLVNPEGETTTVDKETVFVGGFPIEFYDATPGWHEHVDYNLQSAKAPHGAYGLLLQVTATGYQKSANFLVVLNNGLTSGAFATAVSDLTKAEFKGPGDANGDGFVDGADYTIWADHYQKAATWRNGNFNYDAIVDGADYTIWADHYQPTPSIATAVPEPSTVVLGASAAIALALLGWHRARASALV